MTSLFAPLTIGDITFKNRIGVSPMCQYSSEDGFANDWHLVHLGSRAVGGAGLVIMEATAVTPDGRISPGDMGIWKDEHIPALSRITDFIKQHGAVPGIQLAHAGRKASTPRPWDTGTSVSIEDGGWRPIYAPSAIAYEPDGIVPQGLTVTEIHNMVQAFVSAAKRALDAGFQVLEIHSAHGYLLHEFLSPLSNQRQDEYGGTFENRIRFLTEVIQAVKTVWPASLPLFVRISATDWVEGGWDVQQSVQLAGILKSLGVHLIDCSSGALVPDAKIEIGPGYQVKFAEQIRGEAGIKTAAVGIIIEAHQAQQIIESGQADIVLLARELLRDPYWPLHTAGILGVDLEWPDQYKRAKRAPKP